MDVIRIAKTFFMKEDYDFERPDINLYNYHPQLRLFLAITGIFYYNRDSYIRSPASVMNKFNLGLGLESSANINSGDTLSEQRFIWPFLSCSLSLVGSAFEMMFIYRGIATQDYSFATESFCYFIIVNSVPIVFASLLINRDKIIQLLEKMNADFLHVFRLEYKRYKDTFLNGQLIIWQACFGWMTFSSVVLILYILTTVLLLMYQCLFATQNEHTIRPLIFPMWLPKDDPYRTPNYEIFMVFQSMVAIMFLLAFCVYLYVLFHILLHNYTQMDLIILAFEGVFHGVDESVVELPQNDPKRKEVQMVLNRRMKQIVEWHTGVFDSIDTVSSVFGPPLAYQVLFSSMAICLMAYQVVDQLDKGKFDFLFALLGVGACLQLWIPCYIGTIIQEKAFEVGDACWECGWHETPVGRLLLRDIIIVILRTQKPVNIKCTCLPKLQLETFSSIMSTAYSYYNMLRQYN